jgi:hypothetical protein
LPPVTRPAPDEREHREQGPAAADLHRLNLRRG